mmetsp:Transcript_32307/g.39687  ORF Transcript_32307/g.39687 Transcript_32307/m.39687 type:complete len:167 (+) Transcript_32307:140-640(+)|eukprot:CAMPEP_0172499460 /NCGR_PEP_ID=MMETSP1066-20121228/127490_1 /TAXON_ID=671091 /ORGANISM="Coscinodiscus wailesii, Strain CCMP2513" /LENGTH=166 /DNA_ID=CAMNT_0013273219 /DNA_START=127 /DNA_END=627 /DNA_ORIENTATION=+
MYGSGTPLWGKNESLTSPQQQHNNNAPGSSQLNNRYQSTSYQNSPSASYQPPPVSNTTNNTSNYVQQQTQTTEDSLRTQYQAEATANTVLSQMTTQRYQLQNAHDRVYDMRETTEKAKRELADLAAKNRKKKRRLQLIILLLGTLDLFLFLRLLYCGGSFFCRRRY